MFDDAPSAVLPLTLDAGNTGGVSTHERSTIAPPKTLTQARSVATFKNILDTATAIIVERGVSALNTNLVAERAGVNVGTVYHYFPNKTAILVELLRIDMDRRSAYLFNKVSELPEVDDLAAWTSELFAITRLLRHDHPATVALRRAFQSVPELAAMDASATGRFAEHLAEQLQRRFSVPEPRRARAIAQLVVEISVAILDSPMVDGPDAAIFCEEAVRMVTAYAHALER